MDNAIRAMFGLANSVLNAPQPAWTNVDDMLAQLERTTEESFIFVPNQALSAKRQLPQSVVTSDHCTPKTIRRIHQLIDKQEAKLASQLAKQSTKLQRQQRVESLAIQTADIQRPLKDGDPLQFNSIDDDKQYRAELDFATMLYRCGVLTDEDFEESADW